MIHQEMKFLALHLGGSALEAIGIKKTKKPQGPKEQ